MDTYEECLYCQEFAPISECITEYDRFGGKYLNIDFLEISMFDFVYRDGPLDDNFNEPIHVHESRLHMQDAKNNQGIILCVVCKVTIFTCRNSKYHDTFALFYKWGTLTLAITNIKDRLLG